MKRQVLFIHGGGQGAYEEDRKLAAYLQDKLGAAYEVLYPQMPGEESPEYERWKAQLTQELAGLNSGMILVGRSLGGSVLLKYLSEEKLEKAIAGLFLIASPYWGGDDDWQADEYMLREDFAGKLQQVPRIFFYHSRDDKIVPFTHLALYAKKLPQATIREVEDGGHQFENNLFEVVEDIEEVL